MNITPLSTTAVTYTSAGSTVQRSADLANRSAPCACEETFTVSDAARLLGRLSTFLDGAGNDGVITMGELVEFRDKMLGEAQDILRDTLASLRINPRAKITLSRDGSGNFSVDGDLGAKDEKALAEALTGNSAFQNAYAAADSTATILAAGEASAPFAEAYAQAPQEAVRQFSWLFRAEWNSSLSWQNGKVGLDVTHG
jgi:hypothetical protein